MPHCEGSGSGWNLKWVAQRSYGCPNPGIVPGRVGWGVEQPGLGEVVPACGRGFGTRWFLGFISTQSILGFYDSMLVLGPRSAVQLSLWGSASPLWDSFHGDVVRKAATSAGFSSSLCTCQQQVNWELFAQAAAHKGICGVSWFSEAQLATLWGNTPAAYQSGSSCVLSSREIQLTCFLLHLVFLTSKSITWKTF